MNVHNETSGSIFGAYTGEELRYNAASLFAMYILSWQGCEILNRF